MAEKNVMEIANIRNNAKYLRKAMDVANFVNTFRHLPKFQSVDNPDDQIEQIILYLAEMDELMIELKRIGD